MQKTVLITGGARGIGAAVAVSAAARGYAAAINKANEPRAEAVAATIRIGCGTAVTIQADLASEHAVLRMFERVDRELGRLDGLVNNAGMVGTPSRLESMASEATTTVLATNVLGSFVCAREAVRRMPTKVWRPRAAASSICRPSPHSSAALDARFTMRRARRHRQLHPRLGRRARAGRHPGECRFARHERY